MKTRLLQISLAGAGLLLTTLPVAAHHWFPTDQDRPTAMTGSVTKVDWVNPHARVYIDVKDASGKVSNWQIETGSPSALVNRGWKRDSLKVGDTISVEAFPMKDQKNMVVATTVKLPDGRTVFAGSHAGDIERK